MNNTKNSVDVWIKISDITVNFLYSMNIHIYIYIYIYIYTYKSASLFTARLDIFVPKAYLNSIHSN